MTTDSTVGSITDDLLWSEYPEELYLRRILQEQYQDEGTIVDSVMGRSTVADILSSSRKKSLDDDDRCDGRSWLNFSPLAGSVATEGLTSEEESSPSFVESTEGSTMKRICSLEEHPIDESPMKHNRELKKSLPNEMSPRFIDFDEESSTGSLPVRHIPNTVDMEEAYDEEATEIDATRGGLSTLSGDTFLRNIGLQTQSNNERSWIHAADITYAKPRNDGTGSTSKSSKQDSTAGGRKRIRSSGKKPQDETSQQSNSSNGGCCSRIVQKMIDDDKTFRRTVVIAVLFIILFVSLSVFALIRSSDIFLSSRPADSLRPTPNPTSFVLPSLENQTEDLNSGSQGSQGTSSPTDNAATLIASTTIAPSLSPDDNAAEETSLPEPIDVPTNAPTISDPFRFASNLIFRRSPASMGFLGDSQSPQNLAFLWLIGDLQGSMETSEERVLQRWTLALLFYSLEGESWVNSDGWLTANDLCLWFTTSNESICDELGLLNRLDLVQNNLQGSLPEELALLSTSLVGVNLKTNGISGSLPSGLGNLSSLGTCELYSWLYRGFSTRLTPV